MKKTVFGFVLVFGIMAALSSCATTHRMVVDKNVPADRSAIVTFEGYIDRGFSYQAVVFLVKEHNNRNIYNDLYGNEKGLWGGSKTILTVPAGNNRFLFDAHFSYGYGSSVTLQEITNLEISYDLEPGKKYIIAGSQKRTRFALQGGDYDLYVGIYDVTTGQKTLLREWKVGER